MKQAIVAALLCLAGGLCAAEDGAYAPGFRVMRVPLGSGTPAEGPTTGTQLARHVADGSYHVPNYMPGYPTAASIWPREVESQCVRDISNNSLVCDGYDVHPALGRGEYIYTRPVLRPEPPRPELMIVVLPAPCGDCAPRPVKRKKPRG